MPEPRQPNVFISYAAPDAQWVATLRKSLKKSGVTPWADEALPSGDRWEGSLRLALAESDAVVVVLDRTSQGSASLNFELGAAVAGGKRIVPVASERLRLEEIPAPIRRLKILDEPSAQDAGERIAALLRGDGGRPESGRPKRPRPTR